MAADPFGLEKLEWPILEVLRIGPLDGPGLARGLSGLAGGLLGLGEGWLYPALYRLEGQGWVESSWRLRERGRRARFYALTRAGRARAAGGVVETN